MDVYDKAEQEAKRLGSERGKNAGEWYAQDLFGGRSPDGDDTNNANTIVQAIEDGDPAYLDNLPWCDLSGQWADEPSSASVLADVGQACSSIAPCCDSEQGILDAYEQAYNDAMLAEVERSARFVLAE